MTTFLIALSLSAAAPASAPTLPTDTYDAARQCAAVTTVAQAATRTQLQLSAQMIFYIAIAARARPDGDFFEQVQRLSEALAAGEVDRAAAPALARQCDRRFPRAAAATAAQLPSDPFTRDTLCMGVLSIMHGVAEQLAKAETGQATVGNIKRALQPIIGRLTDAALKAKGIDTKAEFQAELAKQIKAAMTVADPLAYAVPCGWSGS